MCRSSRSNKGQWFLVSAVIASSIFLGISFLLRDYFAVPPIVTNEENVYFDNIKNGAIRTVQIGCQKEGGPKLSNLENLSEYIHFAGQRMAALGYLINITPAKNIKCTQGVENFDVIILKSNKADIWIGQRPGIKKIKDVSFSGGNLQKFTIEFEKKMDYDFSVNASIYNSEGQFINSKITLVGGIQTDVDFSGLSIPQSQSIYTIIYSTHIIGKDRWELI